ncbi:MAG TPA: signal peptidase II [Solirubrobacteraceae bacterium]|nr:signal peptidase II [Solirubrobacteraceae bacterium]
MVARGAWARAGVVLVGVVALDQVAKVLVIGALAPGERRALLPFVDLVNTRNTGVAFGLLEGREVIVGAVVAVAVAALVAYFARHEATPGLWLPVGMLLGGALGNVIDRIRLGAVVDFLKLPAWPAFNVADSAITVGIVALFVVVERHDRRRAREEKAAAGGAAGPA